MMFAIFCTDRPGTADLRRRIRPIHRDYLHAAKGPVRLMLSGATLEADGQTMNGSLVVVEAPSLADVEAFAENDPYRQAGLFADWSIRPWDWTFGNPAGTASINPL